MTDALRKAKAAEQKALEKLGRVTIAYAHAGLCSWREVVGATRQYARAVRLTERAKEGR